jgi:hypothetical protein
MLEAKVVLVFDATEKLASDWSNLPGSNVGGVGDTRSTFCKLWGTELIDWPN